MSATLKSLLIATSLIGICLPINKPALAYSKLPQTQNSEQLSISSQPSEDRISQIPGRDRGRYGDRDGDRDRGRYGDRKR